MDNSGTITLFTLDNGLRVVHRRDSTTAMVALNVVYDAGARDERPDLTGLAHLFEHVMFGGSENIADFDAVLSRAGGVNNAFTSSDFTTFYSVAPAHNMETLFYCESDRMLRPSISQETVDIQRSVVIEEFKQQCLNSPYGDLFHHLRPMVYPDWHPYSWPVIGKNPGHIERITRNDLMDWFQRLYAPAGAVLALTGNITLEQAKTLSNKWFGTIPYREPYHRNVPVISPPEQPVECAVHGRVPATMLMSAYLMDPYGTPAYIAADALTDVLSLGKSSVFSRRLVNVPDAVFTSADASIIGSEHQGLLLLNARLASEDTNPADAFRLLEDTARSVITQGIDNHTLQRVKNRQRSQYVLNALDYVSLGQRLAMEVMHNEQPEQMLHRYLAISEDDVRSIAKRLLDDTAPARLVYRPAEA